MITYKISHKFIYSVLVLAWLKTTRPLQSSFGHGVTNNKCIDNERHVLVDFKARLQDPYSLLSSWTVEEEEDGDCCKWVGVTCNNQTGHVTKLDLNNFHSGGGELKGDITPLLSNLTYLTHLDLYYNSFHGSIPESIGFLTKLTYLDLGANYFNGTVPRFIGYMTQLRYLNLESNSFSGTIPQFIGFMTELRHLNLGRNEFHGTILRFIGSMTKLTYLELSGNFRFNGTIPSEFGNLVNLQNLSLGNLGGCTVENLDWLSRISRLRYLKLDGVSLAKANYWVNTILNLKKLSELSLEKCDLSRVIHPYSSSINSSSSSSIDTLYLGNNSLDSSMYRWLFPLTSNKLQTLGISNNMLDGIPSYLGNLCSLASLLFTDNSVIIKFPDFLKNLSGCTSDTLQNFEAMGSKFTGSVSDDIGKFTSLKVLALSQNQLNGTISEKLWDLPDLKNLYLPSNFLKGSISEKLGKSKLRFINLSNNSLEGVSSEAHMSNVSYIRYLYLNDLKLGPGFPKWIQNLKNLTYIDLSNTIISDTIPTEFWGPWSSRITYLNLSSNNISGNVLDLFSMFDPYYSRIDLSSNNFYGPIPNVSSTLVSLNLSRNKFSGGILFICQIIDGFLEFLDLSHNLLTGQIPDCLWHIKELKVLNLGHNGLSGRLPVSVGSLIKLEVLYLHNNSFSGELTVSLKNCTALNFLYLGTNNFSGNVPVWIGENLYGLYVLSLRSNNFLGPIPLQLCQLSNLQILDLSMNNLDGSIPACVNNLTTMVQETFSSKQNIHSYSWPSNAPLNNLKFSDVYFNDLYVDRLMIKWQGNEHEFTTNLRFLKSIDLSSNNLRGPVPSEVTDLHQLVALNLSTNGLLGEIPRKIGEMKNLLILDLSRNKFSGGIPSSMSQMTSLNYLDVSYNNLSGRIPSSTQLQSFEPSRYAQNAGLCGPPVTKICPGDKDLQVPPAVAESKGGGEGAHELQRLFYIGGATGFATGFWLACGAALLNIRGRPAYIHCLRRLKDFVKFMC